MLMPTVITIVTTGERVTETDLTAILGEPRAACPDCDAPIGALHASGCDVERCPRCGGQAIACACVYEVCSLDPYTLEEQYPDIYRNGPTDDMYARFDAEWDARRLPWTGYWPGAVECVALGLWSRWGPDMDLPQRGWVACAQGDPGAGVDLNALMLTTAWGPALRRVRASAP
jgi:Zn-finger nucleic acid-binding protein